MTAETLKLPEKIGYGLGDTASNIVFQVVMNFMMFFYTDVYGLSAAAVGTLMLVVRLFDGFTDPLMGGIADRTRTRWGRYRPYLLWICVPYGILAVLAFTTPDFSDVGKLIYAYITYTLLMAIYTAINIPYSALGGVMTADSQERASIQSWRFALAMIGGFIVAVSVLPLVDFFGAGDKQLGFQITMMFLSTLAVVCFLLCFFLTRERLAPEAHENSGSILSDVALVWCNDQWRKIALITFILLVSVAMRGSVTPYYVSYYLGDESLVSAFMAVGMSAGVAGALFANWACKHWCKVKLMWWATVGIITFNGALLFVPRDGIILAFMFSMLANFVHMIFIPLLFSTVPDSVDYGVKKYGKGAMAMSFSGHLLALKIGIAVGGALSGWILAGAGYIAHAEQSAVALWGILFVFAGSSVIAGIMLIFLIKTYKLTRGWDMNTTKERSLLNAEPVNV